MPNQTGFGHRNTMSGCSDIGSGREWILAFPMGQDLVQAAPSLRLDLPLVALLRQREGEDTKPTGLLAHQREGEFRGKNDVGVRVNHIGANNSVVRDDLLGDI